MKKIFTFVCAALFAFSANAAQIAQEVEFVKAPVAQKIQKAQLSATPALTVNNQKAPAILGKKVVKADHNATPAVSAAPAKAPAAVTEDINVTAVDWEYDDYYYDVYLQSENDLYLFELLESTGGLTYGTTYTFADMYADWVCTLDGEGYPLVKATDATLTVTKDEAGLIHIAATMVLNGVKHVISYDEKPFEPSGVQIPLNGTELSGKYNSYYGMYVYTAKVGDNEIQLAFNATAEQATYTKDLVLTDYCVYYSPDYSTYVEFVKAASDFTVTTTETTKTLAGSLYAANGDEYIISLVYEKPDAKYIDINVANANLTNKSVAGFWTIDGQTADKNNSFMIYFISKALQGTWTDVEKFNSYSTWVSDKSSGSNVYYENLSEVNLVSAIDGDSLKITGTMNLADANGNPAIVTVYITTPFTQTWGEWDDFAPFGLNTGKYTYATLAAYTQTGIQVQVRKDNTGLKQYKLKSWGKDFYDGVGQDLVLNMNPDYTFTFVSEVVNIGAEIYLADVATAYNTPAYASLNSYDPETGVFSFYTAVVFASSGSVYTTAKESLVMDKPITERDTVDIVSTTFSYNDLIATNGVVIYYVTDVEGYDIFRVTSNTQTVDGTFKWSDGTINNPNSYFSVSGTDKNYFQDGEFTMVTTDAGTSLTGWMIGVDEKYYRLNWSKKTGVLDYDADAPFDATFAYEDMEASIKEGVIGIYATNAENYTIGLELYADPAATEIPEGVYTISDSQEAGTALKSAGVLGGYLTECYAGTRAASGGINVPCWFMVEGTVTLSYDEYGKLNVEVDAKNSYGQPVTATVVYSPATSFEEVNAEQTINKVLRNGQVLIRKNNKTYTVLGQEVK